MKKQQPSEPKHDETDERVRRSKEMVLAATFEMMMEAGFGGVSIDAVSKRSGVAKTTIYRHWPSRSALLMDACSKLGSRPEAPDTGSFRGDLEALTLNLAERLQSARWPSILPSIIDAAERNPELAALHSRLHAQLIGAFRTVIERAQQQGEAFPELDPSYLIASLMGPLFYRRWFSREAIDERFVRGVIENILAMSTQAS